MKQITKTFVNLVRLSIILIVVCVCGFFVLKHEHDKANEEKAIVKAKIDKFLFKASFPADDSKQTENENKVSIPEN